MQPRKGKLSARPAHFGRGRMGKHPGLGFFFSVAWLAASALAATPLGAAAEQAQPPSAQAPAAAASPEMTKVPVGYIKQEVKRPIPLSRLHVEPEDYGIAGAEMALKDNNTTGRFTKQEFTLDVERVPAGGDAVAALQKLVDSGHHFVLVDAPAKTLLALSDVVKGKDVLLFNVRAEDEELRQEECRANILHTAPDRYMLADALAQYLIWKKWQRWFVVNGTFPDDLAFSRPFAGRRSGSAARSSRSATIKRRPAAPLRHRRPANPAADAGLHPRRARLRRADRRRRERRVRRLSAVPHLGPAAGRRHRRS